MPVNNQYYHVSVPKAIWKRHSSKEMMNRMFDYHHQLGFEYYVGVHYPNKTFVCYFVTNEEEKGYLLKALLLDNEVQNYTSFHSIAQPLVEHS